MKRSWTETTIRNARLWVQGQRGKNKVSVLFLYSIQIYVQSYYCSSANITHKHTMLLYYWFKLSTLLEWPKNLGASPKYTSENKLRVFHSVELAGFFYTPRYSSEFCSVFRTVSRVWSRTAIHRKFSTSKHQRGCPGATISRELPLAKITLYGTHCTAQKVGAQHFPI